MIKVLPSVFFSPIPFKIFNINAGNSCKWLKSFLQQWPTHSHLIMHVLHYSFVFSIQPFCFIRFDVFKVKKCKKLRNNSSFKTCIFVDLRSRFQSRILFSFFFFSRPARRRPDQRRRSAHSVRLLTSSPCSTNLRSRNSRR